MKMKLLDYTLICLLAGGAPLAAAQEPSPSAAGPAPRDGAEIDCAEGVCRSGRGVLVRVRSRGEDAPRTPADAATAQALQPDRRVEVAAERPGKAVAIATRSLQLPGGGVIWATEDPALGQPELNASAPSFVAFDGARIAQPVRFYVYSNYPDFIGRAEILLYRASDADLVTPVATVPLQVGNTIEAEWDGALPREAMPRVGDELQYVVRAYGKDGAQYDETYPQRIQLVRPEDAERGLQRLRSQIEDKFGTAFGSTEQAQRQSLVDSAYGGNGLRQQNIPIYGSRVRIHGRDIPEGYSLRINGQSQPLDLERKLAAEYLVPIGRHPFRVELTGADQQTLERTLDVDVSGRYLFAVALADVTASKNSVGGSVEPLAPDDRFDDSFLVEGRLAFYLKGKVKGKYLITAQADTQEREVGELFNGFWDADPQDVFRRLDPDLYYPVYGDDSTTYRDVDTQGRLYVRVDWDKNQALWGNFATGFTGTEYGQYSRALYGGALAWRSQRNTVLGEPATELRGFASEAQSAPGHSEFLGTGGSLYYLKHTDLLPGSDRLVLEIRDAATGRAEKRVDLLRGADYDIDELQGRVILTRPLAQVTRENIPTLTRDAPLDGYVQVLLADYEYVPSGFDADELAAGLRGKHWFGDHVALGATYVDENRAGEDYSLRGADLTLQAGRGTYLKLEHAESDATSVPVFFSDNGGLSFTELNSGLGARSGEANSAEARVNLRELGWTGRDWSAGAWWRRVDGGFSVARADQGMAIEERGAELLGWVGDRFKLYSRYSRAERGAEALTQAQLTGEWRIGENDMLGGELRRVDEDQDALDAVGTLAALRYLHRFGANLELYGTAQFTVDDDGGRYADNDALTLGGKYLFGDLSSVGAELTGGDRGDAAQVNAEYRLSPEHTLYGAYTYSTDTTEYDPLFDRGANPGWTLGQRWRLSNQVNLFNESQFLKAPNESGLAHTFGMDFYPGLGWNLGFTLQTAELDNSVGLVERDAVSFGGGRTSADTQWQSKLEWRRDSGAERREQWVTTHRLMHKLSESFRIAARINYSETEDRLQAQAGAKFVEGNLGFAWRPVDSRRWTLLGKYTYLYDVSALQQVGDNVATYDQRSQVLSLEAVYAANGRWEYAGKLMRREGEVRYGRLSGQWAESAATFLAGQVRYEFGRAWHALAEYRQLEVTDGGIRKGFLVGVDRDIGSNFRVGVGYNFTDFSDDLTDFDYDHKGWFLNLAGRY